jgi:hypothetical protein
MARSRGQRSSSSSLPRDRFDEPQRTGRVGAHRIAGRARRAWRYVVAGAIATVLLVTAGILWANSIGGGGANDSLAQGPAQTQERVKPELDPTATIAVLNGTPTPNLAAGVDQVITANGWGIIAFSDDASQRDVPISAVFYASPEDEIAAAGLAAELGGVSTYQSDGYGEYGVRLVVLLGADYAGPGQAEAAALTESLGGASAVGALEDPVS